MNKKTCFDFQLPRKGQKLFPQWISNDQRDLFWKTQASFCIREVDWDIQWIWSHSTSFIKKSLECSHRGPAARNVTVFEERNINIPIGFFFSARANIIISLSVNAFTKMNLFLHFERLKAKRALFVPVLLLVGARLMPSGIQWSEKLASINRYTFVIHAKIFTNISVEEQHTIVVERTKSESTFSYRQPKLMVRRRRSTLDNDTMRFRLFSRVECAANSFSLSCIDIHFSHPRMWQILVLGCHRSGTCNWTVLLDNLMATLTRPKNQFSSHLFVFFLFYFTRNRITNRIFRIYQFFISLRKALQWNLLFALKLNWICPFFMPQTQLSIQFICKHVKFFFPYLSEITYEGFVNNVHSIK